MPPFYETQLFEEDKLVVEIGDINIRPETELQAVVTISIEKAFQYFIETIQQTLNSLPHWVDLGIGLCPDHILFNFLDNLKQVMTILTENEHSLTRGHYERFRDAARLEDDEGISMLSNLYFLLLSMPPKHNRMEERANVWKFVTSVLGKFGDENDVESLDWLEFQDWELDSPVLKPMLRNATQIAREEIKARKEELASERAPKRRMLPDAR